MKKATEYKECGHRFENYKCDTCGEKNVCKIEEKK
jgi:hypothetical protein